MSISDRRFAIGEGPEMGEAEGLDAIGKEYAMDRMNPEELLDARLNSLERRAEQLEGWTGADEDGSWNEPSISERLFRQALTVQHLVRTLERMIPGFSAEGFKKEIEALEDFARRTTMAEQADITRPPASKPRDERSDNSLRAGAPCAGRPNGTARTRAAPASS